MFSPKPRRDVDADEGVGTQSRLQSGGARTENPAATSPAHAAHGITSPHVVCAARRYLSPHSWGGQTSASLLKAQRTCPVFGQPWFYFNCTIWLDLHCVCYTPSLTHSFLILLACFTFYSCWLHACSVMWYSQCIVSLHFAKYFFSRSCVSWSTFSCILW